VCSMTAATELGSLGNTISPTASDGDTIPSVTQVASGRCVCVILKNDAPAGPLCATCSELLHHGCACVRPAMQIAKRSVRLGSSSRQVHPPRGKPDLAPLTHGDATSDNSWDTGLSETGVLHRSGGSSPRSHWPGCLKRSIRSKLPVTNDDVRVRKREGPTASART
jgi:hypothetical protein